MAVHRSDFSLVELDFDHHDVVVVAEDLALDSAACILPRGVCSEDEITALVHDCVVVICGCRVFLCVASAAGRGSEHGGRNRENLDYCFHKNGMIKFLKYTQKIRIFD